MEAPFDGHNDWRAEVLTPSSRFQAEVYNNIRYNRSPDGRFARRYLRWASYDFQEVASWRKRTIRITAWLGTALAAGALFSGLFYNI